MAIKINLIKNRHTLSEAEYQREQTYYRYAATTIVMVVIVTVAIALWQLILTRQISLLENEIAESTSQLQGLADANAKQIYLKSRLKLITSFLDERTVARQAIQKIFSLNIPGVDVTSATFQSSNLMRVQLTADNVLTLADMVKYISEDTGFFLQVVSQGSSRLENGKYQMDILLTLPKT